MRLLTKVEATGGTMRCLESMVRDSLSQVI
jgi:hypothetical protein